MNTHSLEAFVDELVQEFSSQTTAQWHDTFEDFFIQLPSELPNTHVRQETTKDKEWLLSQCQEHVQKTSFHLSKDQLYSNLVDLLKSKQSGMMYLCLY